LRPFDFAQGKLWAAFFRRFAAGDVTLPVSTFVEKSNLDAEISFDGSGSIWAIVIFDCFWRFASLTARLRSG